MIRRPAPVLLALLGVAPAFAGAQPAKPAARPATARAATAPKAPLMASVDPALFRGMQYRLVGHSRGGRVTTVTGVPSQPKTFYMGVASGGLWRTTNGGESWEPITDGKVPVGSMGSVVVADSDPKVIWLGTGSDGVRSNVSTGRGVYRSSDAGATWEFKGLYNAGQIGAVRAHPTNPDVAWVAAYGDIFKPNTERGIFKTTDGGKSWKKTLYVSDSTGAMDVELQPGNPNVVFAWMNRIERKPWSIISGSREGGFYKSTDGGETWKRIQTTGLPNQLIGKGNVAVTAANPNRLYALVEALPGGGLYRSDDAGENWQLVNSTPGLITRPFYYTSLGADPTNADVVYGGAETFYKSTDGGKTVTPFRTPHGDNHDIWINPKDGNTMVQSNDGGANVSFDGGKTWSSQDIQPTAEFYGVWLDNAFPYNLYMAQQDNSTYIVPSLNNPFNMGAVRVGPGCETGPIIPHPSDENIIHGNCKGQYAVMNVKAGVTKNYWIGAQSLYGNDGGDLIFRMQRTTPMATSPHDPKVIYYGSQYLHRSRNNGANWEKISPDLTAFPKCCQGGSGEPITRDVTGEEFYSTLYAIAESPLEKGVIWTGSNDGPFSVTRDDGKSWTRITPKGLGEGGRVAWIDASPHRKGSAYFATYRYLLGDYKPYIYLTNDYGKTWKLLTDGTNGIAADVPVRVVREDPVREGLLYAGTEFGLYISFDNGGHWQPFNLNMPIIPINDIRVHRGDLVIATQGRAAWILDNIAPLQQLGPTTTSASYTVFRPRDGYRTTTGQSILGPTIDYYLPTAPADTVRIEIVDAAGKVVNSFKSGVAPIQPPRRRGGEEDDPDESMMAGRGGRAPAMAAGPTMNLVTKNAGLNRFVWNVQHQNGLGAPPGQYTARLTVGNDTQSVPLRVRIDPRLAADGTTEADLQAQFAHNVKLREMVADVNALLARVRAAETRYKGATGAAADTAKQVKEVSETLNTQPIRYGKPGLQAHITYLAGMTARADQKVGQDAIDRYAFLRKELEAAKAKLDRAIGPQRRM
ncbi:MAG: VPS10 domain-containing protein [Gemmatimonas sp.]|uniref:VPS10 domain-containing protein n=1 Tax=Gemmatimonas sp. TaxID=1962908 RepID=UPI00391D8F5C